MRLSTKPIFEAPSRGTVLVVDDDRTVCENLCAILELEGFHAEGVNSSEGLFELVSTSLPACIVLDLQMPGMSGLEILGELSRRPVKVPVIMMSGHGDIAAAVEAMKLGASDFIVKPFMAASLIARIDAVVDAASASPHVDLASKHGLTPREQEVLNQITRGSSNKEAGRTLGISPRTVEVHRAHVMSKLGARNTADLMRIILSHVQAKNKR
ncbi:MAG: response regulator transcription factor, partial [Hyphomicrobiales bacterium]